ncbi:MULTISPECIES: DUF4245 domain-containing protein [Streptomyces]|uniref:DUF4245 domain-containing protein n=1 Tax=Streptomyces lonegramiae TaxID=3075524 RepID=A0ABU2XNL5_9ACTN|nr:DUF4245 domain-containing protein [Streptomyces sp. DSM 41529]MDT0547034.1 DUF4245 domain-containing protein [Streptomyces sp. DSM 41529]
MRGKETVRDMVLSLAAIGAFAALIYVFAIPHDDSKNPLKTVDYRVELITARRAAPYPVAAPEPGSLPKGWRATSVTYGPVKLAQAEGDTVWHLGFLTPDEEYVAVEQSDTKAGPFIADVTQRATKTDRTQRIDGREWVRYEGDKYNALVHAEPGATTVVTGTATFGQLTEMAAALNTDKG